MAKDTSNDETATAQLVVEVKAGKGSVHFMEIWKYKNDKIHSDVLKKYIFFMSSLHVHQWHQYQPRYITSTCQFSFHQ